MTKQETKKEENKPKNIKKIIITVIIILALIIGTPFGYNFYKESKSEAKINIQKLEDELDTLEQEKHEVFMDEAFSDRYYELAKEIDEVSTKLTASKANLTIMYNILPIIIIGVIVVILAGIALGKLIASSFSKMTFASPVSNQHKVVMGQHKVVLDIVDRRLKEESNKDTKLKPLKCPSCKANVDHEATKCEYCGTSLIKVKK